MESGEIELNLSADFLFSAAGLYKVSDKRPEENSKAEVLRVCD